MTTSIREAVRADVSALAALSRATFSASYPSFLGEQAVDGDIESGAVDQYVQENIDRCIVLTEDGRIVGYAVVLGNLIDLMMIDHALHRRGFGTELLRGVEERLSAEHDVLRLESFEDNFPASAFYRRHGWLEVERFADEDSGTTKIVFQKRTRPAAAQSLELP